MISTDYTSTKSPSSVLQEEKNGEYKLQFMVLEQKREIRELKKAAENDQKEIERQKVF